MSYVYICILNHVYLQHPEVPGKIISTSLEAWTVVLENCGVLRCCAGVWCVLMHWSVCWCTGVWCWIGVWCVVLHWCVLHWSVCCCTGVWWELLDSHEKLHALKHTSLSRSGARYIMDFNWLYAQNIQKSTHKIQLVLPLSNHVVSALYHQFLTVPIFSKWHDMLI